MLAKPKRKKLTKAKLQARADRWFNKFIVLRESRCVICGKTEDGQCSHYYGKKACPAVRYNEDNAHRMCASCHMRHHKFDDLMYTNWMRKHYSDAQLDELERLAHTIDKRDENYYYEIEAKYKALVEKIEKE